MEYLDDLYSIKEHLQQAYEILQNSGVLNNTLVRTSLIRFAIVNAMNKVDIAIGRVEGEYNESN